MKNLSQKGSIHRSVGLILMAIFCLIWQGCKEDFLQEGTEDEIPSVITELPYDEISLISLEGMDAKGENWQIVGGVQSDFQEKHHVEIIEGTGVLLNNQTPEQGGHIFTGFEHGDMELDIEFLMPKGSNSGIYFQSRYEVQLFDSWLVEQAESKDCGGIYERWDNSKPEGERGYEGHPPRQNAAKAPGLWQHFHIKFRAPRFDANGNKTQNAVFEEVIHNGIKIHENVEVTGPTRAAAADDSEVPLAPLMIQGDHGPVAFRNIKFKLYEEDTLTISNLKYDYYEIEDNYEGFPVLDSIPIVSSDTASRMDVDRLSKRQNGVAFRFNGDLNVTVPGDYLFFLTAHNGASLFIDDEAIIPSNGQHRTVKNLSRGVHDIRVDYYNLKWRKSLILEYEGPKQQRKLLEGVYPQNHNRVPKPLKIDPKDDEPEMIRAFVNYEGEKRTHVISVGDPARINYSYDLNSGALLKVWRGGFADMSQAWVGRGPSQLLLPQEMSISLTENVIVTKDEQSYPEESTGLNYKGYSIDKSGRPTFRYEVSGAEFEDAYSPSSDGTGLVRSLTTDADGTFYARVAVGDFMEEVSESYFVIDGNHYLKMMEDVTPVIRESNGRREMLLEVTSEKQVKYAIIW